MGDKSVAIRLGTEGKATVKNDFAEIRKDGEEAMEAIATAAERSSDRIETAADRAAIRQMEAWKRQAAAAKIAGIAGANQTEINSALGTTGNNGQFATVNLDRSTGAARAAAEAFKEKFKAEEQDAQAIAKLEALLNPLALAQRHYDDEIARYNDLRARGKISDEMFAGGVAHTTSELEAAKRALDGHSSSMGLNRTQMLVGASAVHRFADSVLAGTPPMRAFMMQAGDLATVLQMDDGGVAGGLAKVRSLINPVTVGITALTVAAVAGTVAWLSYVDSIHKLEAIQQGLARPSGLDAGELKESAEAAAQLGHTSVAAAEDIQKAFLQMGPISEEMLTRLTGATADFAAAMDVDASTAAATLAASFSDPARGAEELNARLGILTQGEVEHIQKLVEQGRLTEAQTALLNALVPAIDAASSHLTTLAQGWKNVKTWAEEAGAAMGHALDRLAGNLPLAERIAETQRKLAAANAGRPTSYNGNAAIYEDPAALRAQLADLQYQARQQAAVAAQAASNAARQNAQSIVNSVTGDQRNDYRRRVMTLRAGLATDMPPEQREAMTQALDAYTHAIDTFIPAQRKANELAAIDARIAAARTPAARAQLATERERIVQAGQVVTAQQVETNAIARGAQARANASHAGAGHADTLAREAAAMEASARAALSVADAYLTSASAGAEAEARRKALTDATRRGIDVEAQVRRQLALATAEGAAQAAKGVAELREETAARRAYIDQIGAGTAGVEGMNEALADEARLRPLVRLQAIAQGDALATLTRVINEYRAALAEAHTEESRGRAEQAIANDNESIIRLRDEIEFAGDRSNDARVEMARRAAEREADRNRLDENDPLRATFVDNRVSLERTRIDADRAKYVADTVTSQRENLDLVRAEIGLAGKNEDQREAALARLRAIQELNRRNVSATSDEGREILANVDALSEQEARLRRISASMDEFRQVGGQVLDEIFDPSNWNDFGSLGKRVLKELEAEFIKLAALNPLKNLLFGENNPTLGSFGGGSGGFLSSIGKIFGIGSSLPTSTPAAVLSAGSLVPSGGFNFGALGFATGTEYAPGGLAWVGENGKELLNLPRGSRVTSAAETRRLMAANDGGMGAIHIDASIHADGADAAALARVEEQQQRMARDLPGIIISTVRDNSQRTHR